MSQHTNACEQNARPNRQTDSTLPFVELLNEIQGYSPRAKRIVLWATTNCASEADGVDALDLARALIAIDGPVRQLLGLNRLDAASTDPAGAGGDGKPSSTYTLTGVRVLDGAAHEASRLGSHWIEPEHMLLALVNTASEASRYIVEQTSLGRRTIRSRTLRQLPPEPRGTYQLIHSLRRPWQGPYGATVALLVVTTAVTGWAWANPALAPYLMARHLEIADGQGYRLVTALFVHRDLTHLVTQMLLLAWLGPAAQALLGKWMAAAAYLVSGVLAATMSFAFECVNAAGSSVAVMGLIGVTAGYSLGRRTTIKGRILVLILIALFGATIVRGLISSQTQIDYFAHLIGFLGGLAIGIAAGLRPTSGPIGVVVAESIIIVLAFLVGPHMLVNPC